MNASPLPDRRRAALAPAGALAIAAAVLLAAGPSAAAAAAPEPAASRLAEDLRDGMQRIVVIPGAPGEQEIKGTYEKATPGLYGGMAAGSQVANPATQVGPITVGFPIPVLALPGMLAGGIAGVTQREMQEFRDALTEELADASRRPIDNEKLARYVYQELRALQRPAAGLLAPTTAVPEDTDAILHVDVANLAIDVEGDEAVLTTTGRVSIERRSDGSKLYERSVNYQDRAPLGRWTAEDNRLIEDYSNFAMHYLGRQLAADTFAGSGAALVTEPAKSGSFAPERRNAWAGTSRAVTPELAWTFSVPEGSAAPDAWDVEVYDARRLVYAAQGVTASSHTLAKPLAPCASYRWSVRPGYRNGDALRVGDWMRAPNAGVTAEGLAGRDAAAAPAYTQDFATLEIHCKAK